MYLAILATLVMCSLYLPQFPLESDWAKWALWILISIFLLNVVLGFFVEFYNTTKDWLQNVVRAPPTHWEGEFKKPTDTNELDPYAPLYSIAIPLLLYVFKTTYGQKTYYNPYTDLMETTNLQEDSVLKQLYQLLPITFQRFYELFYLFPFIPKISFYSAIFNTLVLIYRAYSLALPWEILLEKIFVACLVGLPVSPYRGLIPGEHVISILSSLAYLLFQKM